MLVSVPFDRSVNQTWPWLNSSPPTGTPVGIRAVIRPVAGSSLSSVAVLRFDMRATHSCRSPVASAGTPPRRGHTADDLGAARVHAGDAAADIADPQRSAGQDGVRGISAHTHDRRDPQATRLGGGRRCEHDHRDQDRHGARGDRQPAANRRRRPPAPSQRPAQAPGAATALQRLGRLHEVAPQSRDECAHGRPPTRPRKLESPRETRWRTAASDVWATAAISGYPSPSTTCSVTASRCSAGNSSSNGTGRVVGQQRDQLGVLAAHRPSLDRQRAPRATLNTPTTPVIDQPSRRDREQPRDRRAAAGRIAPLGHQRRGERLRGQIGSDLGITGPAHEIAEQHPHVAVVEEPERLRVM